MGSKGKNPDMNVEKSNGFSKNHSGSPPPTKKKNQQIEHIYQKKTQLEHILLRPDTYIGSVEPVTELMWISDMGQMVQKTITYVPGLYKVFDEILVNAADNKQRDPTMNCIKIEIDKEKNLVSIWNNGAGIPIVEHKTEKMYVPTLIFGHLLTSSNFNDEEKKVTGGRNGYGAKLCNVFSKKFSVETGNKSSHLRFKQSWENNMTKAGTPQVKDYNGSDFTKVTFQPDLEKFKIESLDEDIVALFSRRAYDVAATTKGVTVYLNGEKVPVKDFKGYVDLFLKERTDETGSQVKFTYAAVNDRWEVAIAPSDNGLQQVSFVNSIATTKGGRHVDYISDMVAKALVESVKKKNKGGIEVKPFQIRNHLWVFVNCLIENPTFDSQTKENMTLQPKSFGSKCELNEKFYTSLLKVGIVESVLSWAKFKAEKILDKNCAGRKQNKVKGIAKLEDANDAGTKHSLSCTLILTEGDSAKSLAVSGLGVVGRDKYGVFPLKGKLLNVREASHKQILENAEINALVKILGLQYKRQYKTSDDMKNLRYGKLMIMTDQDHDGSHIKGLVINFIHHNWPSLLKMNFIEEFITPIVKVTSKSKKTVISFYSIPEFEEWKKSTRDWRKYKVKYYKGLGTSTAQEAKEYFTNIGRHRIKFKYEGSQDDEQINMAFSKKCADLRKDWLTNWMEGCKLRKELGMPEDIVYGENVRSITYSDFINKELVLFSNVDNERSIPSLVDGLKPGQRKVLFTCFKRNDKNEVKVAQLAGSVAEISAYHHGEVSLMSTIINLAQNHVGSNNINLLQPNGQFGTRLQGGKDAASPRYINTMLSPLARIIFDPSDDPILKNLYDDNQKIEPEWYCPIIPMVLVNGADGIGTGWMTKVPNFNPREIVENLRRMIRGEEPKGMAPWYKGFTGEITEVAPSKYCVSGEVGVLGGEKFEITELPVGTWTQSYKESVMEPMANGTEKVPAVLADYKEYHTDTTVRFVVEAKQGGVRKFEEQCFHKVFKLQTSISMNCMVLFDENYCLKRYASELEILQEFFTLRMRLYDARRKYMLGGLTAESCKLSNQARFILEKIDGRIVVENKKRQAMIDELVARKYDSDPMKIWQSKQLNAAEESQPQEDGSQVEDEPEEGRDFNYILGMPMWSLTMERKDDLLKKRDERLRELEILKSKTPPILYNEDLDRFLKELDAVERAEELERLSEPIKSEKGQGPSKGRAKPKLLPSKVLKDFAPSPMAERIPPTLDEFIKKAELATKAKEKKGKRVPKNLEGLGLLKDEPEDDDLDEFDRMAMESDSIILDKSSPSTSPDGKKKSHPASNGAGPSKPKESSSDLFSKLMTSLRSESSEDGIEMIKGSSDEEDDVVPKKKKGPSAAGKKDGPSKPRKPREKKPPGEKKPKKAPGTGAPRKKPQAKKRVSGSNSDSSDDFVSTKKKRKAISDSDEEFVVSKSSPKKGGSRKKKDSSDEEDDEYKFGVDNYAPARSTRDRPKVTKYVFDDDEEEEEVVSD